MNLLDRMAAALRREHEQNVEALTRLVADGYGVAEDAAKAQLAEVSALLSEYARVRPRVVVLEFRPKAELRGAWTRSVVGLSNTDGFVSMPAGRMHYIQNNQNTYAFAELPEMPGREVFE